MEVLNLSVIHIYTCDICTITMYIDKLKKQ